MTRRAAQVLIANVLAAGLLAAGARPAAASGFLVARFGGEQGYAATDDLSALYFNPAGLALRPGKLRVNLNGIFAYRVASFDRSADAIDRPGTGTPMDATAANAGPATLTNFFASPFVALSTDFGVKNLGVAAGVYAPFGGQASWSPNKAFADSQAYPGAVDGTQRWATIDGVLRSLYASAAAAYYIEAARLSIGVSGNFVINEISTVRARNLDGSDDLVDGAGLKEGRSLIEAKGNTASIGVGVIARPVSSLTIGLSYQGQPNFGEQRLKGTLTNALRGGAPEKTDIEISQSLPDVFRLGLRYRPNPDAPKWELRLHAELARWSLFDKQCIVNAGAADKSCAIKEDGSAQNPAILVNLPRNWKDAGGVRVGGSYWVRPAIELYASAGYDSNAVPDRTLEPSLMDMDKLIFSLGTRIDLWNKRVGILATYSQVVYIDRTVPRGKDGAGQPLNFMSPSRNPDMSGTYKQSIGLLSLALDILLI